MNNSVIDLLRERSAKYQDMVCKWDAQSFTVEAKPGGFSVSMEIRENTYTVNFLGWHEDFPSAESALEYFAFGLSNQCRLEIERRGNIQVKWTVQSSKNGIWESVSTTGTIFQAFWRKKSTVYLQNDWIKVT